MRRPPARHGSAGGFTIAEVLAALAVLAVGAVLVAQFAVWMLSERSLSVDRQAAQELAANVLETARAVPWEDLTSDWAAEQRLPEAFAQRGWRLTVDVGPDDAQPLTRRVTVGVHWTPRHGPSGERTVQLVGLFSARSTPKKEEKS